MFPAMCMYIYCIDYVGTNMHDLYNVYIIFIYKAPWDDIMEIKQIRGKPPCIPGYWWVLGTGQQHMGQAGAGWLSGPVRWAGLFLYICPYRALSVRLATATNCCGEDRWGRDASDKQHTPWKRAVSSCFRARMTPLCLHCVVGIVKSSSNYYEPNS